MGLLRQIPREDRRGADGVPEVHELGSSRTLPWVRLSCRVVSSLADNTNRLIFLLTRSLITLRDNQLAGLYPESHGIVGNQFYSREVAICNILEDDDHYHNDGDYHYHNDGQVHEQVSLKGQSSFYAFFNIEDERTTSNPKWWQKVLNISFSVGTQIEGCTGDQTIILGLQIIFLDHRSSRTMLDQKLWWPTLKK